MKLAKLTALVVMGVLLVALGSKAVDQLTPTAPAAPATGNQAAPAAPAPEVKDPEPETKDAPAPKEAADGPLFGNEVAPRATDSEMYELMRVVSDLPEDVKILATNAPWDNNKWTWQSNDRSRATFTLYAPWQATATLNDGRVVVYLGTKAGIDIVDAKGFTLRYLASYPLDSRLRASEQSLLIFEDEYGHLPDRGANTYYTCNGNLTNAEYTSAEWVKACGE